MSETTETITILVKVGTENIKFKVPVTIRSIHFTPVTKHSNVGIDIEYIVENKYLRIKVPTSSNEERSLDLFKDEFERKVCEILLIEDLNLTEDKLELKRYIKSLIFEDVVIKDLETYLFEEKRNLAKDLAKRICKERNLPIPFINFEGCACEDEDQLAHYHPGYNVICISKRQLRGF